MAGTQYAAGARAGAFALHRGSACGIAARRAAQSGADALQEAVHLKAKKAIVNVDSQLVARQLKGEYKVKDQNLRIFFDLALNFFREFDKLDINEVPREENVEADKLVNQAINLKSLL